MCVNVPGAQQDSKASNQPQQWHHTMARVTEIMVPPMLLFKGNINLQLWTFSSLCCCHDWLIWIISRMNRGTFCPLLSKMSGRRSRTTSESSTHSAGRERSNSLANQSSPPPPPIPEAPIQEAPKKTKKDSPKKVYTVMCMQRVDLDAKI